MSTHAAARVAAPTRREQILKEAARLFAERGFHGVGVDEIGAAVGISGPGLYRHFPGKDAMLAELLVGISERLLAGGELRVSEDAASRDGSHEALLDALIAGHIDFALDDRPLITLHDRELDRLRDTDRKRVRRLQRQYVEVWVGVVRGLYPNLPEHEARAAVHAVFGLLNSTPHLGPVRSSSAGEGAASGAVGSKAEKGVDAERRRPTTTPETAVPDAATPRGDSAQDLGRPGALPDRTDTAALLHRLARGAFDAAGGAWTAPDGLTEQADG